MCNKRILFVVSQLKAGGSEQVILDLAVNLSFCGFSVFVAAFNGGVLEPKFREVCKEVFLIEKGPRLDLFAIFRLSKIIKHNQIDIVNAHHYMPCFYSFWGTLLSKRKRLVYTEHSVPEVVELSKSVHGKIFNLMLSRIHAVIGVSKEITEEFKKNFPQHNNKFKTVLNGVDIEKYKHLKERQFIRRRFGFTDNDYVIGVVANFRKVKNHACLLRAFGLVRNICPQLRLMFVGMGFPGDVESSEDVIVKLIDNLQIGDRVVLTGYQDDIPAMLSAFDSFCLPSFSEGLPVSILEAMASGLVVIGSKVSGISEVVVDGETGFLFESDDDQQLSELLKKVASPEFDNSRMKRNITESVISNYDKNITLKKTINIFLCS